MNHLRINLEMPREEAEICRKSLAIEAGEVRKSKIDLSTCREGLRIEVEAEDLSSLRAAINTYLRWITLCINLLEK